jgi:hypothetical protein
MDSPKTWATAQEIANLRFPGLPMSKNGVLKRAKRMNWIWRPHLGQGSGKEFSLLLILPNAPAPEMTKELRPELRARLELLKVQSLEIQAVIDRLTTILM